jgi:CRP-like cAMP-binding protein
MIEKDQIMDFPIFSDTPQEYLLEIAQMGEVIEFDSNQTIFKDGDQAFDLFGVVDGEVELSITVTDKILKADIQYEESIQTRIETIENDIIVETIDSNEIFGWSAFINPRLYTTTAKCSKPGTIISLPAEKLKSIFTKNPQIGYPFMERLSEVISQRLRNRTVKLIESWSQAFAVNRI